VDWNLEGKRIEAGYVDGTIPVTGVVTMSRVAYGGGVVHYLDIEQEINACGGAIRRRKGESISIDHKNVVKILE